MMTAELIDADNHYYEPRDAFTRHIQSEFKDRAVRPVRTTEGVEQIFVGERLYTYTGPQYDHAPIPGSLRTMLRQFSRGEIEGFFDEKGQTEMRSEYQHREPRLQLMDAQGLDRCIMFPTLAVCVEHFLKDDVDLTYANVAAFNRWVEDDWGFAYEGRIFAAAYMSLLDLDKAIAELESLIRRGVRVLCLRPGPQGRRSVADPYFDPFWARVAHAGLLTTFHSSESGYNEMFSVFWGEEANPQSHRQSAFQWTNFFGDRPIMDTLSALVLHNLFGRHPTLRVATVENGSLWVQYLLKAMDKMVGMGRFGSWLGGEIEGKPSQIFKEHIYVSPFHEEPLLDLVGVLGPERVLFGSDFPHAEGLANPADFVHGLEGLPQDHIDLIMGGNLAALLECPA
jgi:predicted TIM-barrel fold metal-dependent hydrolase